MAQLGNFLLTSLALCYSYFSLYDNLLSFSAAFSVAFFGPHIELPGLTLAADVLAVRTLPAYGSKISSALTFAEGLVSYLLQIFGNT